MSTTFPLPPECLHMVIGHLADKSDINTLFNLLSVNKYVWSATLPILYKEPFRPPPSYFEFGLRKENHDEKLVSPLKMVRTLLLSLPPGDQVISNLLRVAYLQNQATNRKQGQQLTEEPPSIPYYSFVTKIDFKHHSPHEHNIFHNKTLADQTTFKDYLEQHGHTSRYLLEEVPVNIKNEQRQHCSITVRAAARELRGDLTWALCSANAERIQELVIPIMDISRYISLVLRLKVLYKVTFLLDKGFQSHTRFRRTYTPAEQEELESQKARRILAYEEMILFAQELCRIFPRVLKIARCQRDSNASNDDCPKEYQFRLLQALPPLISPTVLDQQNWTQFVAKAHETDLSHVKTIQTRPIFKPRRLSKPLLVDGPYLHRCRILESIYMSSPEDDAFQWAVDERKQHDVDVAAGRTPQRPLVPLRSFQVDHLQPSFGRQLHDVSYAFSRTLEKIHVWGEYWRLLTDDEKALGFSVGEGDLGWDMPKLSVLCILMPNILVRIHPDVFSRCHRLVRIFLKDRREEYRLDEVIYWTPTELPLLKQLTLEGTPAISFHPDILKSTTNLTILELAIFSSRGPSAFIPSVEELDCTDGNDTEDNDEIDDSVSPYGPIPKKRPTWTWDWDLPKLAHLKLTSEFAYRFKFKMLAGTPNLVQLNVDISSWSGQHKRIVEIADLLKPGYQHPAMDRFLEQEQQRQRRIKEHQHGVGGDDGVDIDDSSNDTEIEQDDKIWEEFEYVYVPALKSLSLMGLWSLDGRVLEVLFGKVALGVQDLAMSSKGHSVGEFVKASSEHLHRLDRAHLRLSSVSDKTLLDVGLKRDSSRATWGNWSLVEPPAGRTVATPTQFRFDHY